MVAIDVGGRAVGPGRPCFVIAEAGVNHDGRPEVAHELIDVAAQSGADAVKFQTFKTERLVTANAPKAAYQLQTTNASESQYAMLRRLELTADTHREIAEHCAHRRIMFMSTPFDEDSADLLESLGVPAFKIGSGEVTNLPLLSHVARKGRPIILSTGMASLGEVEAAVRAIESEGNPRLVLLHCVSNYPADPRDVNLRAMETLARAFKVPVGYSDHTLGADVAIAAVALGACIIEKHFTLDRNAAGPDHRASASPDELKSLIQSIRTVEAALGHGRKQPAPSEAATATAARRSLVALHDIPPGVALTEDMIAIKRPGTGLAPALRPYLVGRVVRTHVPAGALLTLEMLS